MTINTLLASLPSELTNSLIEEFQKLHEKYYLSQWQISELHGGRFGEVVLRIVEWKDIGTYMPIGTQLNRTHIVNHVVRNTTLPDSLRLTIPQLTGIVMDFRNNRDVAHLGTIDVNPMDASLVINTVNWIMAEIVRVEGNTTPEVAQEEITKIIERKVPIVEEIGGRLKTLDPKLTVKQKILICLYQKYPTKITDFVLLSWIKDKNPTRFRKYIRELEDDDLVDYTDGVVFLTKRGLLWVEKNIKFEIEVE